MIERKTVLDQIEVTATGRINLRFLKLVVDGEKRIAQEYHRAAVEVGGDVDKQMGLVNSHLTSMGEAQVSTDDIARIKQHALTAWSPERLARASGEVDQQMAGMKAKYATLEAMASVLAKTRIAIETEEKMLAERVRALNEAKAKIDG